MRTCGRLVAVVPLAALACALGSRTGGPAATPTDTPDARATPYAQEPAAGICAEPEGDEVVVTLEPGIADPRCLIVHPDQHLRIINRGGTEVTVSLGPFAAVLPAAGDATLGPAFGDYLMPGVHQLQVDPCCGGELWLKE